MAYATFERCVVDAVLEASPSRKTSLERMPGYEPVDIWMLQMLQRIRVLALIQEA